MLNLKKSEDKNKISKNEGYFLLQHPLVKKSPTATDMYIVFYNRIFSNIK